MWMFEVGNGARFLMEAPEIGFVRGELARQHLERDMPVHGSMIGFVNSSHTAYADLFN